MTAMTAMTAILDNDLLGCAAGIKAGEFTAVEATAAAFERIAERDEQLNVMLHSAEKSAFSQAEAVDAARARGDELGPLAGVPLTIKDLIAVAGMPLTAGSQMLAGYMPPVSATVVRRLVDAGAVLLGKNNLDEFAMGSSNENSAFGPVRNPWALDRVPGGSSGGAAAAVAAGYGFGSLGTDTGGSIRLPAALCGVVGIKPTYGRVSRSGVVAFASSLDQVGPIARTVRDAATLLQVIAGPCALDSTCSARPVDDLLSRVGMSLKGLRVGLPHAFFDGAEGLDIGVRASIDGAVAALVERGAELVDVRLEHSAASIATYYLVATAEASANLQRYDGVRFGHRADIGADGAIEDLYARSRSEGFGTEVKRRIMLGTFALSSGYYDAYYERACRVRRLLHDSYVAALSKCDVLVGPVCPTTAWKLGERTADPLALYLMDIFTTGASLAGLPAMSVPVAPANGLPVGLQIIGRHFDEATIIGVGDAVTQALGSANGIAPGTGPAR